MKTFHDSEGTRQELQMNEPSGEQPDPRTIAKPKPVTSGGAQDDTQKPF